MAFPWEREGKDTTEPFTSHTRQGIHNKRRDRFPNLMPLSERYVPFRSINISSYFIGHGLEAGSQAGQQWDSITLLTFQPLLMSMSHLMLTFKSNSEAIQMPKPTLSSPSLNQTMKSHTPMAKNQSSHNDLDLVKAAAWAWYQHGSSSEGKSTLIREFDVVRSKRTPRPTRYKLEAMRNNKAETTEGSNSIPTHNSLLDPYEIESISKRLDQLIELSGIKFYQELLRIDADVDNHMHPKKKRSCHKFRLKGFLKRRVVVCGRNRDVEETAVRLKNHVKVNGKP